MSHHCYAYAKSTGTTNGSWAASINGSGNIIVGGYFRAEAGASAIAGGISVSSGATLFLTGLPVIDADACWLLRGSGNAYGAFIDTSGQVWVVNGAPEYTVRPVGREASTKKWETISSGAITPKATWTTVFTGGPASADLHTLTATYAKIGTTIFLSTYDDAFDVVVKHQYSGGNIWIPGGSDITLADTEHVLQLIYDGTNWCVVGGAGGGGTVEEFFNWGW